jgi:ribulose 1,5-bisphosphate carboxylase large subunit-like protein
MFMNCDFDVLDKEAEIIENTMRELTDEEKKIVESQIKDNENIISKGFDKIKSRTMEMGKLINKTKDSEGIKKSFIEVIKAMILIDGVIHKNEKTMFNELCKLWDVESALEIE